MKKQLLIQLVCLTSIFAFSQNLPVVQAPLNKNVILEQITASNVVQCPPAHKLADQIAAANPGRVVLVNIHAGSYANTATPNYTTADGTAIHDFFNVFFYPSGGVQRIPHSSDLSRIATDRNNWQEQVNTVLGQASRVNVAINATIDATTRVLTVTVEVFYTSPFTAGTTHYLNVGMLQDNIESNQYGASNYPEMVQANGLYQHKHMFRGFVNAGGTWGDPIDASSTDVITKTYTYTLPENVGTTPLKLGKLSFYAFVHAGHNTVTDSEVFSTALTNPVYTNVPVPTAKLTSIVNKFNVCSGESITPIVNVENIGQEITSIEFSSSINGATPVTYTYNGSITTFNNVDITLPQISFTPQATNSLAVTITSVNSDSGIITTATQTKSIDIATDGEVGDAIVKVTTDRYGSEFSWKIYNSSNVVVASGGPYNDASINGAFPQADVTFSLSPDECYYVELIDSFGDGFDAGYGNGDFKVMCGSQNVVDLSTFSSRKIDDKFKAVENLGIKDNEGISNLKIYPNPSTGIYTIETNQDIKLEVYDMVGKYISKKDVLVGSSTLDLLNYADGVYLIKAINTAGDTKSYKVVKRN